MTAYDHSSGYTYGTDAVPTSPLTLEDLRQIEAAAHVQPGDAELLSRAEPILAPHAMDMVDTWRGILAQKTYLAAHSAHPDGQPNPEYAQASKPRFAQWIIESIMRCSLIAFSVATFEQQVEVSTPPEALRRW